MTSFQIAIAVSVEMALAVTLAGLLATGRDRIARFFFAYLAAALTANVLTTWWPEQFYHPWFWLAKQATYDALRLGLAAELAARTFRAFPGAQGTARVTVLGILLLTTAAVIVGIPDPAAPGGQYLAVGTQLHPRVLNGTIWLLAATFAMAQYYRVPLHPFHAAIIVSLGAYMALFCALLRFVGLDRGLIAVLNAVDPVAYLLLACWWAHIAWRPDTEATRAHEAVVHGMEERSCGR